MATISNLAHWVGNARARVGEWRSRRRSDERREVARFCAKVIAPALRQLSDDWQRVGRSVSVQRNAMTFHITVWYERVVEFQYSVGASRRKPHFPSQANVHLSATTYVVEPQKVYALREIRRTDRHRFARQMIEQYRRSLATR